MIRKMYSSSHQDAPGHTHRRDKEVQRIETFSDAVFGFAVTLLIVSLEVPKNFEELLINIRGFFAFGISFFLLVFIWVEQHRYFRKYGMDDGWTLVLNMILLFIVLFYVYPLKYLFTLMFSDEIYGKGRSPFEISSHQVPVLMEIYAVGFIAIYGLLFLMYYRTVKNAKVMGLTRLEIFDCRSTMYKLLIMELTGILSLILAFTLPENHVGLAGYAYTLMAPAISIYFFYRTKIRKKIFPQMAH